MKILRIDASARYQGSVSRELTDELIDRLKQQNPSVEVVTRDLLKGIPLLDEAMVRAYNTPGE